MLRHGFFLALLVALAGCVGEAPHDNPLDPLSEQYVNAGTMSGRVTGIYPPYEGRAGIRVRLLPIDDQGQPVQGGVEHVVMTDADGGFRLEGVPSGRYLVRAEGDGLRPEDREALVEAGAVSQVEFRLDALPIIRAQAAWTVHIERWFPEEPLFRLDVEAVVTDPDRATDVESAELVVEELGFRAPLTKVSATRFEATFDAEMLPGGQVQSLLGRQLHIEVTDIAGNVGSGPPLGLVRVIEQTPLTARPQGLEEVAENPPVLEWRPIQLPFAFTYRVHVYLIDGAGIPNLIETSEVLEPSVTTYAVGQTLPPGDYYWAVWVIDSAGNRSRSKEAGFRVP